MNWREAVDNFWTALAVAAIMIGACLVTFSVLAIVGR